MDQLDGWAAETWGGRPRVSLPLIIRRRSGDGDVGHYHHGPPSGEKDEELERVESTAATTAAATETKRMLREVLDDIAAADYEAIDRHGNTEDSLHLFDRLFNAVNRTLWEVQRRRGALPPSENVTPVEAKLIAMYSAVGSRKGGDSTLGSTRSGFDASIDPLLDGDWEPRRVIMFLLKLARARPLLKRRVEGTAQMLVQVSYSCREAARGCAFITARLGATKEPGQTCRELLSYNFASQLRWACWDATWHWVYARRGDDALSYHQLQEWIKRGQSLKSLAEVPHPVLMKLLLAAWNAAKHTVLQRYPDPPRTWREWFRRVLRREKDQSAQKDEFFAIFEVMQYGGVLSETLVSDIRWMLWNMAWYVANRSKGRARQARAALLRVDRHMHRSTKGEAQWRGVNLGGWFLLEPGASCEFWDALPPETHHHAVCEWTACEALGPELARPLVERHRRTFFSKKDFLEMKAVGLSHVRLPIGAWCVLGPRPGEPYVGPCLEELDRALDLIEGEGLRIVLDLAGAVGGQSGESRCGRENRAWRQRMWDADACLEALRILCQRYAGRGCICGIGVCSEPSMYIPTWKLAAYYEAAVETVRSAGMRAGEVTVLLPIFPEVRAPELLEYWDKNYPRYEDCAFDVHLYQWQGAYWASKSLAEHFEAASARATLVRGLPVCCVSEWCLELPEDATGHCSEEGARDVCATFARLQLEAFESSTHGWFFWTWKDASGLQRSLRSLLAEGVLKIPGGSRRALDLLMQ